MIINQKTSSRLTMIGNAKPGDVVIFRSPPCTVPRSNSFHDKRATLGAPYLLLNWGTSSAPMLVSCKRGDPVRASFGDYVEVMSDAELTL